jgi:hypothetical protein
MISSNRETGADGVGIEFEAALVEMVIRHRNRQPSGEPDGRSLSFLLERPEVGYRFTDSFRLLLEILNIVHQSLRKKVASLDDDNWMFEPERDVRF